MRIHHFLVTASTHSAIVHVLRHPPSPALTHDQATEPYRLPYVGLVQFCKILYARYHTRDYCCGCINPNFWSIVELTALRLQLLR